jgi:hypothetical protein
MSTLDTEGTYVTFRNGEAVRSISHIWAFSVEPLVDPLALWLPYLENGKYAHIVEWTLTNKIYDWTTLKTYLETHEMEIPVETRLWIRLLKETMEQFEVLGKLHTTPDIKDIPNSDLEKARYFIAKGSPEYYQFKVLCNTLFAVDLNKM